ncbi:MAG TPA: hypothetical protein VFI48_11055, partial [Hyphomicrobiaceae bacterium]|nr:hypothetical protein [Hyphomicrobiaceae bacterium]
MGVTTLVIAAATDVLGIAALPAKVLAATANFLLVFMLRRCLVFAAQRRDDLGIQQSALGGDGSCPLRFPRSLFFSTRFVRHHSRPRPAHQPGPLGSALGFHRLVDVEALGGFGT